MSEVEQLRYTISSLESNRSLLGDSVVETTVKALREKLAVLNHNQDIPVPQRTAQRKQITILFASVTGLPGLIESLSDTDLLNIMNVLWQRLDNAITRQAGVIDKHMGDAVMGLFGVPMAQEDDPERAIRAALAMRATLSDFVSDLQAWQDDERSNHPEAGGHHPLHGLQMRIGINTGPVLLGEVGTGDEYTVIGDAVNVASRLQRAAPAGSILISHDTYRLVGGAFNVEPLGPVSIRGRSEPVPVYMVLGVKPQLFYTTGRGVEGVETRMVGRDNELGQLQRILNETVRTGTGRAVTIVGEAGVGKSRLIHEFSNWVRSLSYSIPVFKGRTHQRMGQLPFVLFRDLFATHFEIQDNDPAAVAERKLVEGVTRVMSGAEGSRVTDRRHAAYLIGQLIGLDLANRTPVSPVPVDHPPGVGSESTSGMATQIREQAFACVADFFAAATAGAPAALLFLEDLHWADDGSLELLERVLDVCRRAPLIVICLSRPALFVQEPSWYSAADTNVVIRVKALSEAESRQLVGDILRKLPEIPVDLSNMIVRRAEGNPFYVEELIKVLVDDGVIIAGQEQWRLQRNQLAEVRVPPNITGVLQARLDRLSAPERVTLQRAAVIGRVFWDNAVIHVNEMADEALSPAETVMALQALQKREMIFPRQVSVFAGTQTYVFKHAILRQVTYESVLLRQRPLYHKQVADWLAEQSGDRVAEFASVIAEHYELAGEKTAAAELNETAAIRAQETYNLEAAIDYYCRAHSLLTEKTHQASWQLRLQERLGELLYFQARLLEAAQTYMTMRFTAHEDGDLSAMARAWNGLAGVQREQVDFAAMLASATEAEQVAWLVNTEPELIQALLHKSQAYLRMDDTELALTTAKRALSLSERLQPTEVVRSLGWLGSLYNELGRQKRAAHCISKLEEQLAILARQQETKGTVAYGETILGQLYSQMGHYDKAARCLLRALRTCGDGHNQLAAARALYALGETARLQGNVRAAVPLYRQAISRAEAVGNRYDALLYRTSLGGALTDLGKCQEAESELRQVVRLSEDYARMVSWHGLVHVYRFLAGAYLGQDKMTEALALARQAYSLAVQQRDLLTTAISWRTLGQVLARLPQQSLPVTIEDNACDAPDCFAQSLHLLQEIESPNSAAEQARTLWAWADFELIKGDRNRGQEMMAEAQEFAQQLGITLA